MRRPITRRKFVLFGTGAAATVPAWVPSLSDRVRVGIIGLGERGAPQRWALSRSRNVDVCALCDVNERSLGRAAQALARRQRGDPELFTDFMALLSLPHIDAVAIAVPPRLGASIAVDACKAGKHVFVDSPFAFTLRAGLELERAAHRYRRLVEVAHEIPYSNAAEILMESNRWNLGSMHSISGMRILQTTDSSLSLAHGAFDCLDLARRVLTVGLPLRISAFQLPRAAATETNMSLAMTFEFARDEQPVMLHWEVRRLQSESNIIERAKRSRISMFYEGARGCADLFSDFAVQGPGPSSFGGTQFQQFTDAIRHGRSSTLSCHIDEARISSALAILADAAARSGRAIYFDPETERANWKRRA